MTYFWFYPGVASAFWISAAVTLTTLAVIVYLYIKSRAELRRNSDITSWPAPRLGVVLVVAILLLAAFFVSMLISLPIMEAIYSPPSWSDIGGLLSSGSLALTMSSLLVGFITIYALAFMFADHSEPAEGSGNAELGPGQVGFSAYVFSIINFLHYVFYSSVLISLWFLKIDGTAGLGVALVSWGVFFVVDDWAIVSAYSDMTNYRLRALHLLQLQSVHVLIAVMLCWIVLTNPNLFSTIALLGCITSLGLIFYGLVHDARWRLI